MNQPTLFDSTRIGIEDSIELTAQSLQAYGRLYDNWAVAYSGGKDSSVLVSLIAHLIRTGRIDAPKRLTICYADTRMELPPLAAAAAEMIARLRADGFTCRIALPPMDDRFFVYMFGRGVPPSNNNTFRWCTPQIKVEPMRRLLEADAVDAGFGRMIDGRYRSFDLDAYETDPEYRRLTKDLRAAKKTAKSDPSRQGDVATIEEQVRAAASRIVPRPNRVLMLTGVRIGESAARDGRIALSCGRNGAECGQGWYQETLPESLCDTLAPILHWRVCLVWDWLVGAVRCEDRHGYPTKLVAEAYGLNDESSEAESNARTGCVGCPLATEDSAIENLLRLDHDRWAYLEPIRDLRPLYRWLREPAQRLRQPGGERRKDGSLTSSQNRMGPLTMIARETALIKVLDVQDRCNALRRTGVAEVDILNADEVARIRELIAANTWPQKWTGDEPRADEPYEAWSSDGSKQAFIFSSGD